MTKGNGKDPEPDWLRAKKKRARRQARKKSVRMDIREDIIDSCGSVADAARILSAAINGEDRVDHAASTATIEQRFTQALKSAHSKTGKSGFHYQLAPDGSVRVEFLDPDAADGKLIYEFTPKEWEEFQKRLRITGIASFPLQRKRSGNVFY